MRRYRPGVGSRSAENGFRPVLELAVDVDVDLFVVERDVARNVGTLGDRVLLPPDDVVMAFAVDDDAVVVGRSLVRACRCGAELSSRSSRTSVFGM